MEILACCHHSRGRLHMNPCCQDEFYENQDLLAGDSSVVAVAREIRSFPCHSHASVEIENVTFSDRHEMAIFLFIAETI